MEKLKSCLQKLEPLSRKTLDEIEGDLYLKDIIERNLEVAAQCVLDISSRVISEMEGDRPMDYFTSIQILGDLQVLPKTFASKLAPLAGLRNLLVHQYLELNWKQIREHLKNLSDFYQFIEYIQKWQLIRKK